VRALNSAVCEELGKGFWKVWASEDLRAFHEFLILNRSESAVSRRLGRVEFFLTAKVGNYIQKLVETNGKEDITPFVDFVIQAVDKELDEKISILELNEKRLDSDKDNKSVEIIEHKKDFIRLDNSIIVFDEPDVDFILLKNVRENVKLNALTGYLDENTKIAFKKDIDSKHYSLQDKVGEPLNIRKYFSIDK